MHPYDGTPALLQAFEQLKSKEAEAKASARASNLTLSTFAAVEQGSMVNGGRPSANRASSATFPPSSAVREAKIPRRCRPSLDYNRAATFSPLSAMTLNSVISRHRPHTAPLPNNQDFQPITHPSNGTTAVNTPLSCYDRMSSPICDDSPSCKSLKSSTPCPDLEVYKRHESNGRLMVCEAREQHCSVSVKEFMGERTGLRGMEELKAELLETIGYLGGGDKEQARAGLKVATVGMRAGKSAAEQLLTFGVRAIC